MSVVKHLLAVGIGAAVIAGAQAAPVTYRFEGIASGDVSGVPFSHQALTFTFSADTDDVESFFPGAFFVVPTSSSVALGGEPATSFADGLYVFNIQDPNSGLLGFGTDSQGDLIDLTVGALPSYQLTAPFGPVSGVVDDFILSQFQSVLLANHATLTVTSFTGATFAAVPEPGPLALTWTALSLLVVVRSRLTSRRKEPALAAR